MFPSFGTIYYEWIEEGIGEGPQDSDGTGTNDGQCLMERIDTRMSFIDRYNLHEQTWVSKEHPILHPASPKLFLYENEIHDVYVGEASNYQSWFFLQDTSVVTYEVWRGDSLIAEVAGTDTVYTDSDTSLNYNTEYCYTVKTKWYVSEYDVTVYGHPSNVACAIPRHLGDVNGDDIVDVMDIVLVIDFILELVSPTELEFLLSDVNQDGELNILDVVRMIDIMLGSDDILGKLMISDEGGEAILEIVSTSVALSDEPIIEIGIDYEGNITGVQFILKYDMNLLTLGFPNLAGESSATVFTKEITPGELMVFIFDLKGEYLPNDQTSFFNIPFKVNDEVNVVSTSIDFDYVVIAGLQGKSVPVIYKSGTIDFFTIPEVYALHQNYPNPFNPITNIQFDLKDNGFVNLSIYNLIGQQVKSLVSKNLQAGFHEIIWDGTDDMGRLVGTGSYIYTLSANKFHKTRKMVLLK